MCNWQQDFAYEKYFKSFLSFQSVSKSCFLGWLVGLFWEGVDG